MGYKAKANVLCNGSFDYWQRGTTFPSIGNNSYSADRWKNQQVGSTVITMSRSTDVPTSAFGEYSLDCTITTGSGTPASGDYALIRQVIEGNTLRPLKGKNIVLKFWVRSAKTGIHCLAFQNSNATFSSKSLIKEYTVSTANTWEQKTIRFNHDSSGTWFYDTGQGLQVAFALMTGSSNQTTKDVWSSVVAISTSSQVNVCDTIGNVFRIADVVMVEDNTEQTRDPDFVLAGNDLATEGLLCQRYYWRLTSGALGRFCVGASKGTTAAGGIVHLQVPMRTSSLILTTSGTASDYSFLEGGVGFVCSSVPTLTFATVNNVSITFTFSSGLTQGRGGELRADTANGYLGFDAEL